MKQKYQMQQTQISQNLAEEKLEALRQNSGAFTSEQRKKIAIQKLVIAIKSALFLDEKRRQAWLAAAEILTTEEAKSLTGAIIRENFRWKKGERKIEFSSNL